jgi:hypothetical protein
MQFFPALCVLPATFEANAGAPVKTLEGGGGALASVPASLPAQVADV